MKAIFLSTMAAVAIFTFFGFLLYHDAVEFGDAFKLALGLSLLVLMWMTRKSSG
jgi:hypothetical protein